MRYQPWTARHSLVHSSIRCAASPVLADREPPVTADTIAHTGFWDTPAAD